jgi:hypothetical protein
MVNPVRRVPKFQGTVSVKMTMKEESSHFVAGSDSSSSEAQPRSIAGL